MEIETEWPATTPDGSQVTVELWADRSRRDAQVRILRGPVVGTITVTASPDWKLSPKPDPNAVQRYGAEWVEEQLRSASQSLADRLGTSVWWRR
jgi:hypothetical protein